MPTWMRTPSCAACLRCAATSCRSRDSAPQARPLKRWSAAALKPRPGCSRPAAASTPTAARSSCWGCFAPQPALQPQPANVRRRLAFEPRSWLAGARPCRREHFDRLHCPVVWPHDDTDCGALRLRRRLAFRPCSRRPPRALLAAQARGVTLQHARLDTLFHVIAALDDSNLAHRGGLDGLRFAQQAAHHFLVAGGASSPGFGCRRDDRQGVRAAAAFARWSGRHARCCMLDAAHWALTLVPWNFAIVFSGQGTQHSGMLPWLAEDDIVRNTCAALGVIDWRERLQDRAWAVSNANAQVLLTGLALAAWQQISCGLPPPACVAGYSVGELAAFSAAGVFDAHSALELARQRAQAMDRCAQRPPGGLLAVTGLSSASIDGLCSESGAAVAIRNGADSVVLGGSDAALDRAEHRAGQRGCASYAIGRSHRLAHASDARRCRGLRPNARSSDVEPAARGVVQQCGGPNPGCRASRPRLAAQLQ